jgi:SAM-dependent methyltransferase
MDIPELHPTAAQGFGGAAKTYASGRPDYPPQAATWLREDLHLQRGKTVVEPGAGTGKFTRVLLETGAAVVAVEPVPAMLDRLRAALPAAMAFCATAQRIPLADASADAVVCAQAFHWFASAEALAEFHRVLKPGSVLGLIWNVRDQSVGWVARLTDIMADYEGDAPRYDDGEWRRAFPARGFGELREKTFSHVHSGRAERVIVDRIASVSFIAALSAPRRQRVLDQVRDLIAATPALAGRDTVEFPYLTRAYWCRRI